VNREPCKHGLVYRCSECYEEARAEAAEAEVAALKDKLFDAENEAIEWKEDSEKSSEIREQLQEQLAVIKVKLSLADKLAEAVRHDFAALGLQDSNTIGDALAAYLATKPKEPKS
jgi:signal recognition particle GTPase